MHFWLKIYNFILVALCIAPKPAFAGMFDFYDLEQKLDKIKDAFANSPIYKILLFSGVTIVVFLVVVMVGFLLYALFRK